MSPADAALAVEDEVACWCHLVRQQLGLGEAAVVKQLAAAQARLAAMQASQAAAKARAAAETTSPDSDRNNNTPDADIAAADNDNAVVQVNDAVHPSGASGHQADGGVLSGPQPEHTGQPHATADLADAATVTRETAQADANASARDVAADSRRQQNAASWAVGTAAEVKKQAQQLCAQVSEQLQVSSHVRMTSLVYP